MASLSCIIVEGNPEFALLRQKYLEKISDIHHIETCGDTTDAVMNIE